MLGWHPLLTDGQQQSDQVARHVVQEGVGGDVDRHPLPASLDPERMHDAHRGARLALGAAKCIEVMFPEQPLRALAHTLDGQRMSHGERAAGRERRARAAVQDQVSIGTRDGTVARMEMPRDRCGVDETDIRRQVGIGTQHPGAGLAASQGIEMRDLRPRMHAGIGAPGADQGNRRIGNACERALQLSLHARRRGLRLPAGIGAPVVFDLQRDTPHARTDRRSRSREQGQPGNASIRRRASCFCDREPSLSTSERMLRAPSGSPMSI